MIKGTLIGAGISAAICALLLCLSALILNMTSAIPYPALDYIMLAFQAVSVFIGSYIAAAIIKSRGLIIGLITGALIYLVITILGFSSGNGNIGLLTLIRAAALLLLGAIGGIKGVNKKERIKIK